MLTKEKGIRLGQALLALLLVVALLMPVIPANYVLAEDVTYDVGEYKGDKEQAQWTYPTQEGKAFAGWYADAAFETPYTETTGQAYAKFVDSALLGVKKQLGTGATLASETVKIRFVTAIDSLDYASVTFDVKVPALSKSWALKETTAYTSILVSEKTTLPSDVFGSEAKYFVLHSLTGIPKAAYEAGFEVNVIWETLDGTLVSSAQANTFTVKELIAGNCTHVDADPKDHTCDACGTTGIGGACADGDDANHTCDYCGGEVEGEECVDDDKNHACDECGGNVGTHADGDDANHTCDYCGGEVEGEECVDDDKDHACDECGGNVGTHADGDDANHTCDYCGGEVEGEECVDDDKDHACDECNGNVGTHADGDDANHTCDYCGGEVEGEECVDDDKNHACDECGGNVGTHADGDDANHTCDYCGGEVEGEECVDDDKDHACDECGGNVGTHADGDDANHTCDYCGGEVEGEECVDDDKDHVCDECNGNVGTHADGDDANHTCDYCGGEVEGDVCVDTNDDNLCDECGSDLTPVPYSISEYETYKDTATIFTVASADEMVKLAEVSKADSLEGKTIIMLNSIDLESVDSFAGIGSTDYPFKGTFNGQNYTVSNLKLTDVKDRGGLFNQITGGNVKDLTISDAAVTSKGNFGLLAYRLVGTVKVENVHVKNSTITAAGNTNGGFIYAVDKTAGSSYTLSYCTADNLTIDGLTNAKEVSAAFVAGMPRYMTIDHCMVTNSTITASKSAGLISASNTQSTVVTNFISYGNTVKCGDSSARAWLVADQYNSGSELKNCVFYPTAGTKNSNENAFTLFNTYNNTGVTNVYVSPNNETKVTVNAPTEEELASGKVAYELGWSMKDGKVCFVDDDHKAAVKYTYQDIDGTVTAELYTDYAGNVIGKIPTAPGEYTWSETTLDNGDKMFTRVYYSINEYATYKDTATTFTVASAEEMVKLAEVSKADSLEGKTIIMLNSIDLADVESFAGIGSTDYPFKGTFNGQNYTVSNLKMSGTKLGMFVQITAGQVKNLTISNANIASAGSCGVLAYHLVDAVKITNVHIKDSTITPTGNVNGGFAATCQKDSIRKEISYCTVDNLTIAAGKEQAAAIVGGMPRYVTIDHCMVTNSTINATKSVGLITSSNTLDTVITNFISYGNTVNSGNAYGWLIANTYSADNSELENCVFYPTAGTKNSNENAFTLFNTYNNTGVTNVYVSPNNETKVTVNAPTEEELASGKVAYALGWSMKDGKVCFPDGCKVTVKYTYQDAEGNELAVLYTDYAGNVIGEIPTAPEGFTWSETTLDNGDKLFAAQCEECTDTDPQDHECDVCGTTGIGGACADGDDENHTCDYCQGAVEGEECVDSDTDHVCDECGASIGTHADGETADGKCDYCGGDIVENAENS